MQPDVKTKNASRQIIQRKYQFYEESLKDKRRASRAEKRLRMCCGMRQKTQAQARAHSKWLQFRGK